MSDPKLTPEEATMHAQLESFIAADAKADAAATEAPAVVDKSEPPVLHVDDAHVLHEDGSLLALSPEFLADVDKTNKNWRKWRQVKATDGSLYHHVGESGGEWTYRVEP